MEKNNQVIDESGDYITSQVPLNERRSYANIFSTVAGWVICLSTLLTGGALAAGLDFQQAIYATLIGMLMLTIIAAPLAALGGKYGVSTMMLTRPVFGDIGSKAFGMMIVVSNGIGWFAFQAAFFALTMQQLFPESVFQNLLIGSAVGGVFMTISAMFGYKGVAILSFVAVPLIVLVSFFGSVAAIETGGGMANVMASKATSYKVIDLATGISIVVGNAVIGSIILADISRYAKSAKTGAMAASMGYLVGAVFCIFAGLTMAYVTSIQSIGTTPNLPEVMVKIGLGVGALIILILAQWTTNAANLYSASLGIGAFFNISQRYTVAAMGIIATMLAVVDIYKLFVPFLVQMSSVIPPIGGIIIADYYVVRRKTQYDFNRVKKFFLLNWLAVVVAVASAVLSQAVLTFFTPAFNSLIVGFFGYAIIAVVLDKMGISYRLGEKKMQALNSQSATS